MTTAAIFLGQSRSGGPDDGPEAIRIGFVAELIVDLVHLDATDFYSECATRVLVDGKVVLKLGELIGDLEARGDIGLLDAAMGHMVLDAQDADPLAVLGCNISPGALSVEASWRSILRMIGARPHLTRGLTLEITESSPVREFVGAPIQLTEVQALGCRITVDDFGAGNATARHFHDIDIDRDIVNIDRSYLADLRRRPVDGEGILSLVVLRSCLAYTIVVEGIETSEHPGGSARRRIHWGRGSLSSAPIFERWKRLDGDAGLELVRYLYMRHARKKRPMNCIARPSVSPPMPMVFGNACEPCFLAHGRSSAYAQ